MEISLKTGIEHRFSSSEVKSPVKLHVLLGKLRNFMEFSHGIFKYGLIRHGEKDGVRITEIVYQGPVIRKPFSLNGG